MEESIVDVAALNLLADKLEMGGESHRKPDTMADIEADAAKTACLYFNGKNPYRCSECPQGSGCGDVDYHECCTAQKRDLIRRTRRLLGGE